MNEQRLDRLDRAVTRLMQAQQEALETCERVLDYDDEILDDTSVFIDAPSESSEEGRLYRAALEDVRAVLVGASEDVKPYLERVVGAAADLALALDRGDSKAP